MKRNRRKGEMIRTAGRGRKRGRDGQPGATRAAPSCAAYRAAHGYPGRAPDCWEAEPSRTAGAALRRLSHGSGGRAREHEPLRARAVAWHAIRAARRQAVVARGARGFRPAAATDAGERAWAGQTGTATGNGAELFRPGHQSPRRQTQPRPTPGVEKRAPICYNPDSQKMDRKRTSDEPDRDGRTGARRGTPGPDGPKRAQGAGGSHGNI